MNVFKDISYREGGDKSHSLNIYLPEKDSFPVLVFFHGGGLERGSKEQDPLAETLVKYGIALVSAEYRMYPTASYPDFIKDAAAAVAWTRKHICEYGNGEKLYVGGSSAGAYISMMLCFDSRYLAPYGILTEDIDGYIHDAGQPTVHFNVLRERGVDSRRILVDEAAPLYHVCANKSYPPMFFIVSDNDMPNRLQETELLLSALKTFGHDMSKVDFKMMHGTHTAYGRMFDENGDNVRGKLYADYLLK